MTVKWEFGIIDEIRKLRRTTDAEYFEVRKTHREGDKAPARTGANSQKVMAVMVLLGEWWGDTNTQE